MRLGLIFAMIAFVFDQLSKWLVQGLFERGFQGWSLGNFFNLVEAWNTGVSFSLFAENGSWGVLLLTLLALCIIGFLLYWLAHENQKLSQIALGMIIGGALGNVLDRIRFGAVYDFLDFHYANWHWPAFNIADSCICVGVVLLILQNVLNKNKSIDKE